MTFHDQLQFLHYVFKILRPLISKAGTHIWFGAQRKESVTEKYLSTLFSKAAITFQLSTSMLANWSLNMEREMHMIRRMPFSLQPADTILKNRPHGNPSHFDKVAWCCWPRAIQ